ncbi:hypothetical protein HDV00_010637 [Rhizophlyctis rosea]|nr:hypothetical protein HDV00_010637 [Rhizophlyctis rosea]
MTASPNNQSWQATFNTLEPQLRACGFNLIQPFPVARYNRALNGQASLPTFGRASTLGIIVANAKALWNPFIQYLAEDPEGRIESREHPLNEYVKDCLERILADFPQSYEIRYPDDKGEKFVHFQPLCHISSLAYYSRSGYLCIHPEHGPWMAMRAVIVVDIDGPDDPLEFDVPHNPIPGRDAEIEQMIKDITAEAARDEDGLVRGYEKRWPNLLAIRERVAEMLGEKAQQAKYDYLQLHYHYTKDKKYLRESVEELRRRN